jgi:hypothetical protein
MDPVRKSVISRNPGTAATSSAAGVSGLMMRTNTTGGVSGGAVLLAADGAGSRSSVLRGMTPYEGCGGGGQEFMPIVIPGSPPPSQQDFFYRYWCLDF